LVCKVIQEVKETRESQEGQDYLDPQELLVTEDLLEIYHK